MSWIYALLLAINGIALLVALGFILSDKIKYPNAIHNRTLIRYTGWFAIWVGLSCALYWAGLGGLSIWMLGIPALPIVGYGFFLLMFILLKPDMK